MSYKELQTLCKNNKHIINVRCNSSGAVLRKALLDANVLKNGEKSLGPKRRALKEDNENDCLSDQVYNPKSKRCIKRDGIVAKREKLGNFALKKKSSTRRVPSREAPFKKTPVIQTSPPSRKSSVSTPPKKMSKEIEQLRLKLLQQAPLPTIVEMCEIDLSWEKQCNSLDLWSYLFNRDFPGTKIITLENYFKLYKKNYDVIPIFINFGTSIKFKTRTITISQILSIFISDAGGQDILGMIDVDDYIIQADPKHNVKYQGLILFYVSVSSWEMNDGLVKQSNIAKTFVSIMNAYMSNSTNKDLRDAAKSFYERTFSGQELRNVKADLKNVDYCKIRFSISPTSYIK